MKAMILAAGYGKRLRPFSETTPKSLFTIGGRPILDRTIHALKQAGCHEIIINVHYLADKIRNFLSRQSYGIPVHTQQEEELLGTGGAIKNVENFWDDQPFFVVNSDIVTNVDLSALYEFHLKHKYPVTLTLYDDKEFNTVTVDEEGNVTGFDLQGKAPLPLSPGQFKLTFTGVQVLEPELLKLIPAHQYSDIIKDTYDGFVSAGHTIKAYTPKGIYWKDIGTPDRYRQVAYDHMVTDAFDICFPGISHKKITREKLAGDGSDRKWYRIKSNNKTLILADHGIRNTSEPSEAGSFVAIGSHLRENGVPVPVIYHHDTFPGLVFMEDLGDVHLQTLVIDSVKNQMVIEHYQAIIRHLIHMSQAAGIGFDPSWAYQTPRYDRELIHERECRYFVDAFLKGYLNLDLAFDDYADEFSRISDRALEHAVLGFMHRDFQSRNIIVNNNHYYFIDFQGGRMGPLQYDLASLLIDPYVALPYDVQDQLVDFTLERLMAQIDINPVHFHQCYTYCRIARNFQILGAFGFLTRGKGKSYFEHYIPRATSTLKHFFSMLDPPYFPKLKKLIDSL